MCIAIEEMKEESRREGEARGEARGKAQGEVLGEARGELKGAIHTYQKLGFSREETQNYIMKEYDKDGKEAERLVVLYWK